MRENPSPIMRSGLDPREFQADIVIPEKVHLYRGDAPVHYLAEEPIMGSLPLNKADAKRVRRTYLFLGDTLTLYMRRGGSQAREEENSNLPGDMLYKRFYDGTPLRCLYPDEASMTKECAKSLAMQGVAQPVNNYDGTLLRCLYPDEARSVIEEIHEGSCAAP
nr:uncharacterized protein LOC109193838 [Ipomoea batatas]GMC95738.1 uncharacterized protein LOC109193838 [Ipomoea batatas]